DLTSEPESVDRSIPRSARSARSAAKKDRRRPRGPRSGHAGRVRSSPMVDERRLWIARELTGGLGPLVWGAVHLFEQWSAFGGREAFVSRTTQTGHGALATAAEILIGIAPVLAYIALDLILARREEPETLAQASAEDEALARRL